MSTLQDRADSAAEWILGIAKDLRGAGDVRQVCLSEEGVSPATLTVAEELELIAFSVRHLGDE